MIIALRAEETTAINIARPSAVRIKLKPKGRFIAIFISWPCRIDDKSKMESRNDEKTSINANKFLKPLENLPIKGKITAPINGRKTTKDNANSLFIFIAS